MSELNLETMLRAEGKRLMDQMRSIFPGAEIKGTIAIVPDDPDYIALVLKAEYGAKAL